METPQTNLSGTQQMVALSLVLNEGKTSTIENRKIDIDEYAHTAMNNEYTPFNYSSLQLLAIQRVLIQKDQENDLKIKTEIKRKVIFAVLFILSSIITIYLLCNEESAKYKIIGTEIG
eukprot:45804_1